MDAADLAQLLLAPILMVAIGAVAFATVGGLAAAAAGPELSSALRLLFG